jgi:hypothetical protein
MVLGPISPARRAALGPDGAAWDEHQDLSHNMTSTNRTSAATRF